MDVAFIRAARTWWERLCHDEIIDPQPLTAEMLGDALGDRVLQLNLWRVKWNTRIYRVELSSGRTLIAKQLCTQTDAELKQEYDHLASLSGLEISGLSVPRTVALLSPQRAYVMEFVHGRTLESIGFKSQTRVLLSQACECAGEILAKIHAAWLQDSCPIPVDAFIDDLCEIPGGLSARSQDVVRRALDRVIPNDVAVGQPYLDFNPRNVICDAGALSLIDPPGECWRGLLMWDVATFRVELRRAMWKHTIRHPVGNPRGVLDTLLAAFAHGYERTGQPIDLQLVRLLELQRVGQQMTERLGQIRLLRRRDAVLPRQKQRLRAMSLAVASLSLLKAQKRQLLRQLRSGLSSLD